MSQTCESCGAAIAANEGEVPRCDACSRIARGVRARTLRPPHPSWSRYLLLPFVPVVSFALTIALRFALDVVGV